MIVKYFILKVTVHPASHNAAMKNNYFFILGKICACITISGSIGEYNSPSIVLEPTVS